ncbi:unnamed protein product [marine sediment metagenome]|uniref:Uncharacterized protein n=1 Tax=marine sediment metagenome TaxID=412755 RepID=X1ALX5_9ZZZZ
MEVNILYLLLVIIVVGVVMWIINRLIPMAAPFKMLLNLVVVALVVIWILQLFGLIPTIISFPQLK